MDAFGKVIELSGLPINQRSMKFISTTGGNVKKKDTNVTYCSSPDELVQRLQLLLTASKEAGKQSKAIDNEIVEILTRFYNDGTECIINKDEYSQIYMKYK